MSDETVSAPTDKEALAMQENEEILALLEGQKELEPGDLAIGDALEKDKDSELEQRVSSVTSAGYVMVFDRVTGDPSVVNRNMLPTQLRKRHPETHSLVFTLIDPGIRPPQGTFKCMLHKDAPERSSFNDLGLATCKKANLKTAYQQTRHMTRRHKDEWAVIQDNKARAQHAEWKTRQEEDRQFQRMILAKLTTGGTDAPTKQEEKEEEVDG